MMTEYTLLKQFRKDKEQQIFWSINLFHPYMNFVLFSTRNIAILNRAMNS